MQHRTLFSSNLASTLTMVGVAVGLGNVWRFPYMMGQYGGSAFLLVYLLFTLLFAIPAIMGEWALGREARSGLVDTYRLALGAKFGSVIGYSLILVLIISTSYYIAVVANLVFTGFFSIAHGFTEQSLPVFKMQLNQGGMQYAVAIAILLASLYVIKLGLNKGIEAVSKVIVPFFFLVIIYLVISVLTLPGAFDQAIDFLQPDFTNIQVDTIFAALGQAFFSVGLGGTFLLVYGSYLKAHHPLPKSALILGLSDMSAAVLASLFIVPTVLIFGIDLATGPQLIFHTLPTLFTVLPGGRLLGSFFLLALILVTFLSVVAALEVLINGLGDLPIKSFTKTKRMAFIGALETLIIFPSAIHPELIGILDMIFGSGMQVLGGIMALIAITWGFGKQKTLNQVFGSSGISTKGKLAQLYFYWVKVFTPMALLAVLALYIISKF